VECGVNAVKCNKRGDAEVALKKLRVTESPAGERKKFAKAKRGKKGETPEEYEL